jgi:hypothetical protein
MMMLDSQLTMYAPGSGNMDGTVGLHPHLRLMALSRITRFGFQTVFTQCLRRSEATENIENQALLIYSVYHN